MFPSVSTPLITSRAGFHQWSGLQVCTDIALHDSAATYLGSPPPRRTLKDFDPHVSRHSSQPDDVSIPVYFRAGYGELYQVCIPRHEKRHLTVSERLPMTLAEAAV
jgi:hypothetical protein